jgi:hypothetical protein
MGGCFCKKVFRAKVCADPCRHVKHQEAPVNSRRKVSSFLGFSLFAARRFFCAPCCSEVTPQLCEGRGDNKQISLFQICGKLMKKISPVEKHTKVILKLDQENFRP